MSELIESISKMIPSGNRLELPKTENFSNYAQVKRALLNAGGKYKKCGFEFSGDAEEIQTRLTGGEVINDKKKYQFFATPLELANKLVSMADIVLPCRVLEPSAGHGAISNIMRDTGAQCIVVELMKENAQVLRDQGYDVQECCFLTLSTTEIGCFDKIVANPPFTKNQDIDHIKHMYSLLRPGGNLVSVASKSWVHGSQKKQTDFRKWLDSIVATVTKLPPGEFKQSGTNVSSVIVEIYKAY